MAAEAVDLSTIATILGSASSAVTAPVVVWLFVTGRIVRGSELDKKDAQLQRKDDQISSLQAGLVDKAIPTITEAIVTMRQLTPLVEKLAPLIQTSVSITDQRRKE